MNTELEASARGARRVVEDLFPSLGVAPSALERLDLTGDAPVLPSSFHVAVAAQASIACATLAATELGRLRGGDAQRASVDMTDAELECTGYFTLDGQLPNAWAPLSGLYPCQDGHVRIHANFEHHRDGALKLLGIDKAPSECTREDVAEALTDWPAEEFEQAAADAGLVVAAVRSFAEWDRHPQAEALGLLPVLSLERIGDAAPLPLPARDPSIGPLAGIRVLDLTRILAGPICGRTLAAYGADVMLVNSPSLPNIEAIADTSRGKLSVYLDLTQAADSARLGELADGAHVFVQGYHPGGLERLGFGPAQLAARRPGIVYVTLSAYGHEGPWAARRGFDSLVQTATGFNHAEAEAAGAERPKPLPIQILDYASGFLMAFAAQAGLVRQASEGGSWHARISLAQTARWIRSLGRLPDGFRAETPDLLARLEPYPSGYGALAAMPHAGRLSSTPVGWSRPSVAPGTNEPVWPT